MAKAPAFQFYAADFLTDTAEMTDQEVGVYIRLLSHQWVNGSLHGDPNRLANGVAIGVLEVWPELEHKFPLCDDGRRRNQRLEDTRQQQQEYRDKQAEAGRQGALKRWSNQKDGKPNGGPIGDTNNNPNGENIALQSSSSSSSKSSKDNTGDKSPNKKFIPPTVEEVKAYCVGRGSPVDPESFVDYYNSSNWFRGKTKIKDWKACIRTWEKNQKPAQASTTPKQKELPRVGQ